MTTAYRTAVAGIAGLQSWWMLDESTGNVVFDTGPLANNAAASGTITQGVTDPQAGSAVESGATALGSGGLISAPNNPAYWLSVTPTNQWIVIADVQINTTTTTPALIELGDPTSSGYAIVIDPVGKTVSYTCNGITLTSGTIDLTSMQQLAVSWDGTHLTFWVNGAVVSTTAPGPQTVTDSSSPLTVGPVVAIAPQTGTPIEVDSGGPATGAWAADTAAAPSSYLVAGEPGSVATVTNVVDMTDPSIPAGTPMSIMQSERYAAARTVGYDIPVPPGQCTVRLFFAENYGPAQVVGGRVQTVTIGGVTVDANLDVFALVGAFKAVARTYTVTTTGTLQIRISNTTTQSPHVMAVYVVPPVAGPAPTILYGPDPAYAPTYTVHITAGSDIQAAFNANPVNTIFGIDPGTYRVTTRLVPKSGQQLHAIGSGVVISGASVLTGWTASGSNFVVGGQTQRMGSVPSTNPGEGRNICDAPFTAWNNDSVYYDNVQLLPVGVITDLAPGRFFFDYPNNNIYIRDNPTGHTVEVTQVNQVLAGGPGINNCVFRNITFEKGASAFASNAGVMSNGGTGWQLIHCEGRLFHSMAFYMSDGSTTDHCFEHHNGEGSMSGQGANNVVTFNELAYNNTLFFDQTWEASCKWSFTTGLVLTDNWSHHNNGPGFWLDIENTNYKVLRNLAEYNTRYGIGSEIDGVSGSVNNGGEVGFNVTRFNGQAPPTAFAFDGCGYNLTDCSGVNFHDNISFMDGRGGIVVYADSRAWNSSNHNFQRNTVTTTASPGTAGGGAITLVDFSGTGTKNTGLVSNNNSFWLPDQTSNWFARGTGPTALTPAAWRALGFDVASTFLTGVGPSS